MTLKERALTSVAALKKEYPDALCSLTANNALELLIATRLSAQCTDARVNLVTPALFEKYTTMEAFADADVLDIENLIRSCGFYHTKAREIKDMCRMMLEEFDGKVPDNIEDLTRLPGIGRKTANIICGDIYGKPAVAADTHCIRLTNRIGLTDTKDPYKVEMQLMEILPPEESNNFCHRCVLHGRAVCTARKAKCELCVLSGCCKSSTV